MKRGIEVWQDWEWDTVWCLRIRKAKGRLTLDEIYEAAREYAMDVYVMVIKALDQEGSGWYDVEGPKGDMVTLYRADDACKDDWR